MNRQDFLLSSVSTVTLAMLLGEVELFEISEKIMWHSTCCEPLKGYEQISHVN